MSPGLFSFTGWQTGNETTLGVRNMVKHVCVAAGIGDPADADQATNLQTEAAVRVSMLRPRFR